MHTIRWEKHNPDMSSAKCISVEGVNGGVGSEIGQRYLSFDDSCKWSIGDVGNGQYEFTLKSNNFKLNVAVGSNEEGTRLQLDNGNGQDCQKFQLNNNSFNYEVF